jgi:hypothetical protein
MASFLDRVFRFSAPAIASFVPMKRFRAESLEFAKLVYTPFVLLSLTLPAWWPVIGQW